MTSLKIWIEIGLISFFFKRSEGSGCAYNSNYNLFREEFQSHNPATSWTFEVQGQPQLVQNQVGWPKYKWMPDGHISSMKNKKTGEWLIFYPNSESYRTVGPSPLPEKSRKLSPRHKVIGGKIDANVYNSGGMWLMSVHQTSNNGKMIGFVHAEDSFYGLPRGEKNYAYKSVALACSSNYGESWKVQGVIQTRGNKPAHPSWSGGADQDVVWDWKNKRWYMGTVMSAAVSYDKSGRYGSWKKWDGEQFSLADFKAEPAKLRDTNGNALPLGAHPSIHWNTYLQLWVMVYNGYDGNIYITSARDLPYFSPVRFLKYRESYYTKNWYPTLISNKFGDRRGGRKMTLYYRNFPEGPGQKKSYFKKVIVKFSREKRRRKKRE